MRFMQSSPQCHILISFGTVHRKQQDLQLQEKYSNNLSLQADYKPPGALALAACGSLQSQPECCGLEFHRQVSASATSQAGLHLSTITWAIPEKKPQLFLRAPMGNPFKLYIQKTNHMFTFQTQWPKVICCFTTCF